MKKSLSLFLILACSAFGLQAQNEHKTDSLDIVDRFGNRYKLEDIAIPHHSEVAGIFRLHFLDDDLNNNAGFDNNHPQGNNRRAVFVQVCRDISVLLGGSLANNPYPGIASPCGTPSATFPTCRLVEIEVRQSAPVATMPAGVLAMASQYYGYSGTGVAHGNVWNMINSGWDPYYQLAGTAVTPPSTPSGQFYHGYLQVNFNDAQLNWYTNLASATPAANQYDLYSVLLHEMMHALGMASLIDNSAQSVLTGTSSPGPVSLWDTYLSTTSSGTPNVAPNACNTNIGVSAGQVGAGCGTMYFNGTNLTGQQIYSPSPYAQGSSLSHFNCLAVTGGCPSGYATNDYALNVCSSQGTAWVQRTPHQNEVFALCDLGYTITNTYGTTSSYPSYRNNYTTCATGCPSNMRVAGVNDFRNYNSTNDGTDFSTPFQTAAVFSGFVTAGPRSLLDNDFNAVGMSCVSVVSGGGTITVNSPVSFTYTPATGFCGDVVLSYRPVNSCGKIGNITFVFLSVGCPALPICETTSQCGENLVCNGDFESFVNNTQMLNTLAYFRIHSTGINTPDLCDLSGNNYTFISAYAGSPGSTPFEAIVFPLTEPIEAGCEAFISLDASILPGFGVTQPINLQVLGSVSPPCNAGVGVSSTACGTSTLTCPPYTPVCMMNSPVSNAISGASSTCITVVNTNFANYTGTYTNTTGSSINYIMILAQASAGFIVVDNIFVSKLCGIPLDISSSIDNEFPCPGSTSTISYEVCNNNPIANPQDIELQLNLPANLTVVGGDFNGSGHATIPASTLPPSNCIVLDAEILVSPAAVPGLPLPVQLVAEEGGCIDNWGGLTNELLPGFPGLTMEVESDNPVLCEGIGNTISVTVTNNTVVNVSDIVVRYTLPPGIGMYNQGSFQNLLGSTFSTNPFNLGPNSSTVLTFEILGVGGVPGSISNCVRVTSAENACDLPQVCFNFTVEDCSCTASSNNNITDFDWDNSFSLVPGQINALGAHATVTGSNVVLTDAVLNISQTVKIIVDNGAQLTLDHCHLYSCDEMWQGIVVKPGGTLNIINGTLIEDAVEAVDITNASTATSLNVFNAIFNKNRTGIHIDNFTPQMSPYPFLIQDAIFTSRTLPFTATTWPTTATLKTLINSGTLSERYNMGGYSSANLKAPYSGQKALSGVTLTDIGNFNAGTNFYYDVMIGEENNAAAEMNLFDNLQYGIDASNSDFTVYNSTFQSILKQSGTGGIAIRAIDPPASTTFNRILVNSNSNAQINWFYDCSRCIEVENYDQIHVYETDMRSTQQVTSTYPAQGEYGVNIRTPHCTQISAKKNVITNIRYGITFTADVIGTVTHAQSIGPVTINDNTIRAHMPSGSTANPMPLLAIAADNIIDYSIATLLATGDISITNNHLHDVHNGILSNNWYSSHFGNNIFNFVYVTSNYVRLRNYTMRAMLFSQQLGIQTTNCYNPRVQSNNVVGFVTANTSTRVQGIYHGDNIFSGSLPIRHGVICNTTQRVGRGIVMYGNQAVRFHNNTMDNCYQGFVISNTTGSAFATPGYSTAYDNTWINFTLGSQYKTHADLSDASNAILVVRQSVSPYDPADNAGYNTATTAGNQYTFANGLSANPAGNGVSCIVPSSLTVNNDPGEFASELESKEAGENQTDWIEKLINAETGGTKNIIAQHDAYMLLYKQPELQHASRTIEDFYRRAQESNIAKLLETEALLAKGKFAEAAALNGQIVAENVVEENYKKFYGLYLKGKNGEFSTQDSLQLEVLAQGCPAIDGKVVYKARSLYNLHSDGYHIYNDNCGGQNSTPSETVQSNDMVVYPNPGNGTFTIRVEGNDRPDLLLDVTVTDLQGKILEKQSLKAENSQAALSLRLSSGVYLVSVKDENGTVYLPEKITIIR